MSLEPVFLSLKFCTGSWLLGHVGLISFIYGNFNRKKKTCLASIVLYSAFIISKKLYVYTVFRLCLFSSRRRVGPVDRVLSMLWGLRRRLQPAQPAVPVAGPEGRGMCGTRRGEGWVCDTSVSKWDIYSVKKIKSNITSHGFGISLQKVLHR